MSYNVCKPLTYSPSLLNIKSFNLRGSKNVEKSMPTPGNVFQVNPKTDGWSIRFSPTPGRSATTGIYKDNKLGLDLDSTLHN